MSDKPLKALIFSNCPHIGSGYGVQTDLFSRQMVKEGWDTYIGALYGHVGQVGRANGVTILPQGYSDHGEDMLIPHYTKYTPDVYVLLYDIWVYDKDILRGVPNLTAYAPIDSRTIPPRVLDRLRACRYVWAMSKHGERLMNEAGIANAYVPHGVDCEAYRPVDRADAREKLGLPQDAFVACMVAANKGFPDRKNIRATLKAWGEFVKRHPGSVLYLHTLQYEVHGGLNIKKVADHYGIPDDALRLPDPYAHVQGQYSPKVMNLIYNAADVKLLPSGGEGFGVPVIEAQAAGCPVIVTDATAQTELCGAGWLIPIDPLDGYELSLQYAEWARVLPSQIITALESALAAKDDTALREKARAFGLTYEIGHVWETYAKPAIMAQVNARDTMENERQARTAARRAMRKIKAAELEEDVKYLALNGVQVGNSTASSNGHKITLETRDAAGIEAAIRRAGVQQGVGPQSVLPRGMGWAISQSPKEAAAFLAKMDALGVRSVLEIGTYNGGLARFMGEVMGWDVTSIDITRPIATPKGYTFVQADSRTYQPERTFDLVFIDGDHRYEGVKGDYTRYAAFADKVVAMHDVHGLHECEGVKRFYGEISEGDARWTVEKSDDWPLGIAWREMTEAVETEAAS